MRPRLHIPHCSNLSTAPLLKRAWVLPSRLREGLGVGAVMGGHLGWPTPLRLGSPFGSPSLAAPPAGGRGDAREHLCVKSHTRMWQIAPFTLGDAAKGHGFKSCANRSNLRMARALFSLTALAMALPARKLISEMPYGHWPA